MAGLNPTPDADEDAALMARYAKGDAMAARLLSARLLPRILSHATRVLGDRAEAEDIAQEVMLRLWKIAPQWRADQARPSTWAYRVTANLLADRLRRVGRGTWAAPDDAAMEAHADDRPNAEAQMIAQDRMARLDAALARLPERQRQAVVLRHIEGLSNPEIAAILDLGVEAVESLTARGKRALSQALLPQKEVL